MDAVTSEFQSLNDLANELIDLKVKELLLKTTAVFSETDPDYRAQVVQLKAQCQGRIEAAGARLSLRLRSVRELGRAHELLELLQVEHAKARARQEVLCNIYTELEKTLSERMLNKLSELRRAQRRALVQLRVASDETNTGEDSESVTDTEVVVPRPTKGSHNLACPFIVYTLQPHEIEEDLRAIQQ
ncbi:breast cancer metastasis-suppressor 1 protein-like, partial [Tropilaelaps mercedesae]